MSWSINTNLELFLEEIMKEIVSQPYEISHLDPRIFKQAVIVASQKGRKR